MKTSRVNELFADILEERGLTGTDPTPKVKEEIINELLNKLTNLTGSSLGKVVKLKVPTDKITKERFALINNISPNSNVSLAFVDLVSSGVANGPIEAMKEERKEQYCDYHWLCTVLSFGLELGYLMAQDDELLQEVEEDAPSGTT